MNANRFDIEIEVLQQKTSDLQARLNDMELQKPDSKLWVEKFTATLELLDCNPTKANSNKQFTGYFLEFQFRFCSTW